MNATEITPACQHCGSIGANEGRWYCWLCTRFIGDDERAPASPPVADPCQGCERSLADYPTLLDIPGLCYFCADEIAAELAALRER